MSTRLKGGYHEGQGAPSRPPFEEWCLAVLLSLTALAGTARSQVRIPPPGDRSVHDFAGVVSSQHVQTMERLHTELFEKTGVAIVVVTVPRLEGEPIEDFAVRIGQDWGVGRKDEDRGIVVALAVEDRRVFIATGYGVEGFLPDGRVGRILDQYAIPHLRQNDYSTGLLQTSAALVAAGAEEYGITIEGTAGMAPPRNGPGRSRELNPMGALLGILFFLFMAYMFVRHPALFFFLLMSGGGRGGGGSRGGGFGGGGFGGFGGGGFGGGGAGRSF